MTALIFYYGMLQYSFKSSYLQTRNNYEKCLMKKSWKIPKGGNQNPYIEEGQTTQ